jgi:hypothetical protein
MTNNNTQLPVEVAEIKSENKLKLLPPEWQKEIIAFAEGLIRELPTSTPHDVGFYCGALSGITVGAAEYATKLHLLQQENDKLKDEFRKAIDDFREATLKVIDAKGQVEKEHDELREHYNNACRTLSRMTLSMQVHPDNQPNSEFFDLVEGANETLAIWEGKLTTEQIAKRKEAIEWYRNPAAAPSVLRETIEDIILSAGKHSQEQCTEIADAILRESGQSKEGNKSLEVEFLDWLTRDSFLELIGGQWTAKGDVDSMHPFSQERIIEMFKDRKEAKP